VQTDARTPFGPYRVASAKEKETPGESAGCRVCLAAGARAAILSSGLDDILPVHKSLAGCSATIPGMHPTQYFTYPVLSLAIPALVAFITTMLVIKFGPNKGEVSRLAKLVQGIVDDQENKKKLNHFRCDVSLENLVEEGSRVTFTSAIPFRLLQVKMANANRAPFHIITVDSGIGTTTSCIVPHDAINKVYWSTQGTTTKDAVLLFAVEVAGIILHREQAVSLLQLNFQRTGDPTFRQFVRMS
jgi:hypothetical protein